MDPQPLSPGLYGSCYGFGLITIEALKMPQRLMFYAEPRLALEACVRYIIVFSKCMLFRVFFPGGIDL